MNQRPLVTLYCKQSCTWPNPWYQCVLCHLWPIVREKYTEQNSLKKCMHCVILRAKKSSRTILQNLQNIFLRPLSSWVGWTIVHKPQGYWSFSYHRTQVSYSPFPPWQMLVQTPLDRSVSTAPRSRELYYVTFSVWLIEFNICGFFIIVFNKLID